MTTEEKISARIAELRAEMAQYIVEANQRIAAYQAVIGELEKLVTQQTPPAG